MTQTSKEKTIVMLRELQEKVKEVLGLYDVGSIPSNCLTYGKRDNVREWESQRAISNCQGILRDDYVIPSCSDKQKPYVEKILGGSDNINFYQAKELLGICFNSDGIYDENDKEQIISFYKSRGISESRVIRLSETELKRMIAESVRNVISKRIKLK